MPQIEKICVTGATGFVGKGVTKFLLDNGYSVRALVRPSSISKLPPHARLEVVGGDVLQSADIAKALEGCSALIHLVGMRRAEMKKTGLTYEDVDLGSVKAAIAAMRVAGMRRIVLLSAGDIGHSLYVQIKQRAEQAVMDANLQWTILRPAYIVGPGQQWPIAMAPLLSLLALLPGHFGAVCKRARNVSLQQLSEAIDWSLSHKEAVGRILDVTEIRRVSSLAHE